VCCSIDHLHAMRERWMCSAVQRPLRHGTWCWFISSHKSSWRTTRHLHEQYSPVIDRASVLMANTILSCGVGVADQSKQIDYWFAQYCICMCSSIASSLTTYIGLFVWLGLFVAGSWRSTAGGFGVREKYCSGWKFMIVYEGISPADEAVAALSDWQRLLLHTTLQ